MARALRPTSASLRVLFAVASLSPVARAAAAEASPPAPVRLETVNGTVRGVDLAAHAVTVEADGAAFTVSLDRNTLVYLPGGRASVADLRPGARVRLARDGSRASWIEVREQPGERSPLPPPSQGTGPGGGAPPPDSTGPPVGPPRRAGQPGLAAGIGRGGVSPASPQGSAGAGH